MGAESSQESGKRECVVVDTSIWRAEPLLKTPLGVTLGYTLSRRGGVVGLPEVVELELTRQIVEAAQDASDKARRHLHVLRTITDDPLLGVNLPNADVVSRKVNERIAQLAPVLVREPFTLDHAKAALAMVNAKVPPNGRENQQYKDSAIWQAVLSLSMRFSTTFLTTDKAFFHERDPAKGLAENLVEDCAKAGTSVGIFFGVGPYLESLKRDEPVLDIERARELLVAFALPLLNREAERVRVVVGELLDSNISAFPTERGDRLAIDYTLTFKVDRIPPEQRDVLGIPDKGIVHGSCYFFLKDSSITDHYVQRIALKGGGGRYTRDFKDYDSSFPIPRPLPWD